MARAISSLPVPVSPVIRTMELGGGTLATRARTNDSTNSTLPDAPTCRQNGKLGRKGNSRPTAAPLDPLVYTPAPRPPAWTQCEASSARRRVAASDISDHHARYIEYATAQSLSLVSTPF